MVTPRATTRATLVSVKLPFPAEGSKTLQLLNVFFKIPIPIQKTFLNRNGTVSRGKRLEELLPKMLFQFFWLEFVY